MSNWTLSKKLWSLGFFTFFILTTISAVIYVSFKDLSKDMNKLAFDIVPTNLMMGKIDMMHDGILGGVYKVLYFNDINAESEKKTSIDDLNENTKNINKYMTDFGSRFVSKEVTEKYEVAKPLVENYVTTASKIIEYVVKEEKDEDLKSTLLSNLQKDFDELEVKLGELNDEISALSSKKLEDNVALIEFDQKLVGMLYAVGGFFSFLLIRNLTKTFFSISSHLKEGSDVLSESSNSMKSFSELIFDEVSGQAAAVQETAASLNEITAMVQKTRDNSTQLSTSLDKSSNSIDEGQQSVTDVLNAIREISEGNKILQQEVELRNKEIANIVKVISEIGEKTKVINEIVFQTKLLSFNASVEAARAGEHGKGFAVVAEEVGNLAQMSGNASEEISKMLESGINKVKEITEQGSRKLDEIVVAGSEKIDFGSELAKKCGVSFDEIVGQINNVKNYAKEIISAIEEQSKGVEEISSAINQFDKSGQATAKEVEKSTGIANTILGQAQGLNGVVIDLAKVIGQKKSA